MRRTFILLLLSFLVPSRTGAALEPFATIVVQPDAAPEEILDLARRELALEHPRIIDADLRLEHVRSGLTATHYRFKQWIDDLPVHGTELLLSISTGGRVSSRHVSLALPPRPFRRLDLTRELRRRHPEIFGRPLIDRAPAFRNHLGRARAVERFVVEDAPYRWTTWEVDAVSGQVRSTIPSWVSVKGRVFTANPVTILNDPTLRDAEDSAAAVPESAYSEVELTGLPAAGELESSAVRIVDIDSPFTSRARVEDGLIFDRDRDEFEEVNVFHQIESSQSYLQSLGYTGGRQIVPEAIRIDVHANRGSDNSFYSVSGSGPTILFGDGGVDDAEDPDIVLHEYGHAIHDSLSRGVLFGGSESESRAISEGFSDYWAFSSGFSASIESGRDPFCVGDWDARCDGPSCGYPAGSDCLRRVDDDLTMNHFIVSGAGGTEHRNGRIWSTFLRDIFMANLARYGTEEGRRRTDTIILEALQGLPFDPDFDLVVERMIEADSSLHGGEGIERICTAARARKLGVPLGCRADLRGETLVLPPGDEITVLPGTSIERHTTLESDARIDDVMVYLELDDDAPRDLRITLVAPDGTRTLLKASGTTMPKSVTFGRDRLAAGLLEELESRANPGVWTLKMEIESGDTPVVLKRWMLILKLDQSEKLEVREPVAGSRFFPAVAHTPGAEGTVFATDLFVANPAEVHEVTLIFTPSGEDGTSRFSVVRASLPANGSTVLTDLVSSIFDESGTGSLEVRGAAPEVRMSSRTYNRAPAGTFGQTIPQVRQTVEPGHPLILSQIRRGPRYRTNVGFSDVSGKGSEAIVTVRDRGGEVVGSLDLVLEPFAHRQIPLMEIVSVSELEVAWAEVVVTGADDSVSVYSSVVDNLSGDSVFVPGVDPPSFSRTVDIPAVAHVPGARGTLWRTDLWFVNASDQPESVEVLFLRPGGPTLTRSIAAGPATALVFEDVVGELFQTEGTGWIRIEDSRLIVSSRTWNEGSNGSYGQYIGSIELENAIRSGETAIIPRVVMSGDRRSNVGVTELLGLPVTLVIDVMDGSGMLQCSFPLELGPHGHSQYSLLEIGCGSIGGGRVEIRNLGGGGGVAGYVSVVDQNTGDPVYLTAN